MGGSLQGDDDGMKAEREQAGIGIRDQCVVPRSGGGESEGGGRRGRCGSSVGDVD